MDITRTFYPKTPNQWRVWLDKHHDKKKEIWVIFFKKHTGKQTLAYQDAVDEALCFGWIDGMEKRMDDERYALRFTPRLAKSNWSETNVKRYKVLSAKGRMTESGKLAFEQKT